jgi:hypothetical protein
MTTGFTDEYMEQIKLCFIDLDGVLVDNSERETEATFAARKCFNFPDEDMRLALPAIRFPEAWKAIFYSKLALYNPAFIELDTLQEGAIEALDALTQRGYFTFFLTSRPDTPELRKATEEWLQKQGFQLDIPCSIPGHDCLIMKPPAISKGRVFTNVWKASVIQMFAAIYEADSIIVIDDDTRNIDEMSNHKMPCKCGYFASLKATLEHLENEDSPDPDRMEKP